MSNATLAQPAPAEQTATPEIITAHKRTCDACPSNQVISNHTVAKGEHVLDFCTHHARRHEASLLAKGFVIEPPVPAL